MNKELIDRDILSIDHFLTCTQDVGYRWELKTDNIQWFGATESLFAKKPLPACGKDFYDFIHKEDLLKRTDLLSSYITTGQLLDYEYRIQTENNQFIWVQERARTESIPGGQESPAYLWGTIRIIDPAQKNHESLAYLASYDELTGYFNKHRFCEFLDQALAYSLRHKTTGAYMALALNNLDVLNIAYGYAVVNSIITQLTTRIKKWVQATDIVGRVSGNCYGILISQCTPEELRDLATSLLATISDQPFETNAGTIHVTSSIGSVVFPAQGEKTHELITKADSALALAKRHGCSTFVLYHITEEQRHTQRQNMVVSASVQKALLKGLLKLCFQPVLNREGNVAFYESLVRMIGPNGDLIRAGKFVPIAERLGLARSLDRWVMEAVTQEVLKNSNVRLAFNISGLTLNDDIWMDRFKKAVANRPEAAQQLIIEITETATVEDLDVTMAFIKEVRALGCAVALDDFGAGYTSFFHLKTLPIDILKIDGAYVQGITSEPTHQAFVDSLLTIAGPLGIQVVAECIESKEDYALLHAAGVQYFQGYLFGKPSPDRPWFND